ncbi:MAG: hypothetical protein QME49_07110 [bacterium]|nr:hypothetical protein [bacterium]
MKTISELKSDLAAFEARRDSLLELKGVISTMNKAKGELITMEEMIAADKVKMKGLLSQREKLIRGVTETICVEVDKLLTNGKSNISIGDGKVDIGWIIGGQYHPYSNLSGGERVSFINALSQTLCGGENPLTHLELAEAGDVVGEVLHVVRSSQQGQVIACTCNWDDEKFNCDGWDRITL